jgi:hypothetical protein
VQERLDDIWMQKHLYKIKKKKSNEKGNLKTGNSRSSPAHPSQAHIEP